MTATVGRIVDQVKKPQQDEHEELLDWLAERQASEMDAWDKELERDSRPGGRLQAVMNRVRQDIAAGRTGRGN
jgi:hypothetical protein